MQITINRKYILNNCLQKYEILKIEFKKILEASLLTVYVSRPILDEFFGHMDKISCYTNVFFQVQWAGQLILQNSIKINYFVITSI